MKTRLELTGIRKAFGRHRVLDQAWLHVRTGEAVGLLGANGAGKTTMMRIAAGLVCPDAGLVRWQSATPLTPPVVRYFGGETTIPPDVRAHRWASLFGIVTAERRIVGRLSRGTRQTLGLRALLAGPPADVLLLDEPWEGLDPSAAKWLTDTVRIWMRSGAAVLIASHRLYDLDSVCSRFVMLDEGRCQPLVPREERPRLEQIEQAFVTRSGR